MKMEILFSRTALHYGLLLLIFRLNVVASADKLFIADATLGQIFVAETGGDSFLTSTFTPLNLSINESPVGIDYDYRYDMLYWSDETTHTIHRATVNGSFHHIIVNHTIEETVPHGIMLDLGEDKVFWVTASTENLHRANLDGSDPEILTATLDVPRGITISYNRRKLYITTRDANPAITSMNTDGTEGTILIDTDIVSPSGITFDFAEKRLYWADDSLDKIESIDPDNISDRVVILSVNEGSGLNLVPYGIALHHEDVYFTDINNRVIVFADFPSAVVDVLNYAFTTPTEIHIYTDECAGVCLNNGSCIRKLTSVECSCPYGFVGPRCELDVCTNRCENGGTCRASERGSICICPEGFSGSKCDSTSKSGPIIFVCDKEGGAILESSADSLDFSPLPIPNLLRPIAVAYNPEDDMLYWVDSGNDTLNRAFRNGSDHNIISSRFSNFSDIAISPQSRTLAYIASGALYLHYGYNSFDNSDSVVPLAYSMVQDSSSVCLRANGDIYASANNLSRIVRLGSTIGDEDTFVKPSLSSPLSIAFDRQGSRLFILDDIKQTLETCSPFGENQDVLFHYQNTKPVDVGWYRGTAFWTDDSSYNGIGFMPKRGSSVAGVMNINHFQKAQGIHVYYGKAHERPTGDDCLEDEFACNDTVCIPTSWICDGLVDCAQGLDESDCLFNESDSLVFVSDLTLQGVYMATVTNLSFIQLPLTGVQAPVAVDYDPVEGIVFWTDSYLARISSARLDGTNQQTVVSQLGTPDGLFFDITTKTIFWTDAHYNNINAIYPNGTGRRNIISNVDKPRAIIIVPINRMIYWTEWGSSPKIEMCDLFGQNRQVVIDTDLGWPNGITFNRQDSRIYWCDALLDKIESSNIDGSYRRLLLDRSDGLIRHPFDIIFHSGTLMWTDWDFGGIGIKEGSPHAWPKTYMLPGGFTRPAGFHVVEEMLYPTTPDTTVTVASTPEDSSTTATSPEIPTTAVTDILPTSPTTTVTTIVSTPGSTSTSANPSTTVTSPEIPTTEVVTDIFPTSPTITVTTVVSTPGTKSTSTNPSSTETSPEIHTTEGATEPIRVTSSPSSLTIGALESVTMTCSFANAIRFEWQKDDVTIQGTDNQNVYTILSMSPSYIGYYRCRGVGGDQTEVFTEQAALYISELTNIVIQDATFHINVSSSGDLSDHTSQYYQDAQHIITNYVHTGMINASQLDAESMFVVASNLREGSIIADLNIYVLDNRTSSFEIHQNIESSFFALSLRGDGILDASMARVTSTSICSLFKWMSRFGEVVFDQGEINVLYNSTGRTCPFNTTNANQAAAVAQCVGDQISRPNWKAMDNCGKFRNVTDLLQEIESVEITEDTVEEVTDHVAIITENTEEITSSDLSIISHITSNIAAQNTSDREVTAMVSSIVSNIASVSLTELQAAEKNDNAISNMLTAYETQLTNVDVAEGEPFEVAEENLAVQVRSVPGEELEQGLVLSLSGSSSLDLTESNITVTQGGDIPEGQERVGLIVEVSIPPEVASIASSGNNTNIIIIMNVFSTPVLFYSPSLLNFSQEYPDVNRTVNTPVILLNVGGMVIQNLSQTINLTFTALEPGYVNQTCTFWDESEWSSKGCNLIQSGSGTSILPSVLVEAANDSGISLQQTIDTFTCGCDHLTNFAILMDIHNATTEPSYTILTYIGCAISIVCLLISLGTYLWNKKLRSRQTHQIFICLCASLLGLYVSFVAMLAYDALLEEDEKVIKGACSFLAALIHFFVLSSIAWMGVEGFNTYLVIVRVFNSYIPRFMVKAGLVAWGIPAILVIGTGAIANTKYARNDVCFLNFWSQVGGLLIPVAAVLIANVIVFILVIRQLVKSAQISGKIKKDKEGERQETIERIKNAVTILVLLGLTWITGYLLFIEHLSQVIQPLFILFNAFQGLFIFILYCMRKPMIRKQWGLTCSWCDDSDGTGYSSTRRLFPGRSARKFSITEDSLTFTAASDHHKESSASISNTAYGDIEFGKYTQRSDESEI